MIVDPPSAVFVTLGRPEESHADLKELYLPPRNEPNVHKVKQDDNKERWHGAELSVTILGNWQYYRSKILKYLRQIAVITPYAQFSFVYKAEEEKNDVRINFVRRTDKMPQPPKASSRRALEVQKAFPTVACLRRDGLLQKRD